MLHQISEIFIGGETEAEVAALLQRLSLLLAEGLDAA